LHIASIFVYFPYGSIIAAQLNKEDDMIVTVLVVVVALVIVAAFGASAVIANVGAIACAITFVIAGALALSDLIIG